VVVTSVTPPPEPNAPPTKQAPGYFIGSAALQDASREGGLMPVLRNVAALRDGNAILKLVADLSVYQFIKPPPPPLPTPPPPYAQELLTAMTQLAVTGSAAFAAWAAAPTLDLTPYLNATWVPKGLSAANAATINTKIIGDFNAALQAVRNPGAGINEPALRGGMASSWIAVSAEDDAPDFPVNVFIAPYPQFHLAITVDGHPLNIRYILASSQLDGTVLTEPFIPPGNEIVLFIHGEGSRAEEACDFIPALFSVGADARRSFTVVSLDLPGSSYSTMIAHTTVSPMPQASTFLGLIELSGFAGSPILDFVEKTIVTFVETLLVPLGNPITAVMGGSLGGHMSLRLAAGQYDWVKSVLAWSPASVEDYTTPICAVDLPNRVLADPALAALAMEPENLNQIDSRIDFFSRVWDENTFPPRNWAVKVIGVALALWLSSLIGGVFSWFLFDCILGSLLLLPGVPPQPHMWYRDDWGPVLPGAKFGQAKEIYIAESRLDRHEIYGIVSRQWHWRICEEILGFTFDALAPQINKPLLFMAGELDNYPDAHFVQHVSRLAQTLTGPGYCLTVQDTGHSIHAERPYFLANQLVNFTTPILQEDDWLFAAAVSSI
jgi:pimeloyl-ACP methyl ester carboxylesterase